MISIFSDLLEVFMDDFIVNVESFEACMHNLSRDTLFQLEVSRSIRLKYMLFLLCLTSPLCRKFIHFMVMQVFIDFNKIALPLSKLLQKDTDFVFDQPYVDTF
ncbi:hypothetical protein CR513_07609, partial [Mucuna pruriens]